MNREIENELFFREISFLQFTDFFKEKYTMNLDDATRFYTDWQINFCRKARTYHLAKLKTLEDGALNYFCRDNNIPNSDYISSYGLNDAWEMYAKTSPSLPLQEKTTHA